MKSKKPRIQALVGQVLLYTLIVNSFIGITGEFSPAHAQRRIIVVNADQPNLWTLEQAHYLLAQMHRRNLDLKAKSLEELDPNEIDGLRFDVMRMLVEFGATFNQADLVSNRLLSNNQSFNSERRQQLLRERDGLRRESVDLAGDIETLETEKASTEDKDAQKVLDAKIAAKTNRLTRVDKEIETLNGELGTLNAPSGQPTATTGGATFDPNKLPKSDFDEAFKAAAAKQIEKFNQSPELNASLKLDNFLQMQYEIISKQLSLLRDELGPGERLVFLELPQTVNAAHHESNKKWAQSWWKIAGYTRRVPTTPGAVSTVDENNPPITTLDDINSIIRGVPIPVQIRAPVPPAPVCPAPINFPDAGFTIPAAGNPRGPSDRYPATINVAGVTGTVRKVTVTLNNLSHTAPDDLDVLLVGPNGQTTILISDIGGRTPTANVSVTLDSEASHSLLAAGPLVSGTFKPTNSGASLDTFPSSAPAGSYGAALSSFKGIDPNGPWSLYVIDDQTGQSGTISSWNLQITLECPPPIVVQPPPVQVTYEDTFINLDTLPGLPVPPAPDTAWQSFRRNVSLSDRTVRTVELIPRQSSLNVNDMKLKVKAGALNFVFSSLFGFGSQLKAQRQREQFSQFVQQELYSAAFGKGSREFGWTFTPMPGTDRLHSGVRTTYAVVVVPEEATSLVLESNGCYFPRSYYPPNNFANTKDPEWNNDNRTSRNCSGESTKAFVVPIPAARVDGGNEFWVDRIDFQGVAKGKQIVVAIRGRNFSPQMGALINGVPLVQSIGLAQPLIRDDSAAGQATAAELKGVEIPGRVERIDSDKVLLTFKMPSDFQGTPTITLIAPGRATDINLLPHVGVNEVPNIRLADYPRKMFGHGPGPDPFRVDKVKVFRSRTAGKLTAQVSGAGFGSAAAELPLVLVNGSSETPKYVSATVLTVDFAIPPDETVRVTLVSKKGETVESDSVANPAWFLSISRVDVVSYEPATEDDPTSALLVKITGTGFTDNLKATFGEKTLDVAVRSATEAVVAIPDPKAASFVTLEDTVTKQKVKVVVTRKSKPK
jgi:subtilisin-like proprotein convertase family protein